VSAAVPRAVDVDRGCILHVRTRFYACRAPAHELRRPVGKKRASAIALVQGAVARVRHHRCEARVAALRSHLDEFERHNGIYRLAFGDPQSTHDLGGVVSVSFHRYKATSTPRRRAERSFVDPNARFVATHAKYSGLLHVILCITYITTELASASCGVEQACQAPRLQNTAFSSSASTLQQRCDERATCLIHGDDSDAGEQRRKRDQRVHAGGVDFGHP
jgi:hypothetical protein